MLAEDIVMQTTTAAFARGPDGTITAWNELAEKLLARPAGEVVGKKCHEVVAGRDVFGNDYCSAACACWRMAAEERPILPYRLTSNDAFGRPVRLRVSILAADGGGGPALVHLLESTAGRTVLATRSGDLLSCRGSTTRGAEALTRRELEVLHLLAGGWSTRDIAERLAISPTTVRNHVARCLRKLEVHSRLEAVSVARRLGLI